MLIFDRKVNLEGLVCDLDSAGRVVVVGPPGGTRHGVLFRTSPYYVTPFDTNLASKWLEQGQFDYIELQESLLNGPPRCELVAPTLYV